MGTRHKVRVIQDNKVIINQYGQWDGYPTCAGEILVNFLKDKENIEFLKSIKDKFEYHKEEEQNEFIFGEMTMNPEEDYKEIYKFIYDDEQYFENEETGEKASRYEITQKQFVDEVYKRFGYEKTASYMMITRNTGYKILDTIKELNRLEPNKIIPIFISEYEGWDIEARYTVNLDSNKLSIEWHDHTLECDLDNLPSDKKLEDFEEEVRKIREQEWKQEHETEEEEAM